MTEIREVGQRIYTTWEISCRDCLEPVTFDVASDLGDVPEKNRIRLCPECRAIRKREKSAATRAKTKARRAADFERGRLSVKLEQARRELQRRKRWQTVPSTLRTHKELKNG